MRKHVGAAQLPTSGKTTSHFMAYLVPNMATAEQIKTLIHSHFSEESESFFNAALQVAAHEAGQGHSALAREIRDLVDRSRQDQAKPAILHLPSDLQGLVRTESLEVKLSSLVLPKELTDRLHRAIHEYRQQDKLKLHGLSHRRKLLLTGPPGTGKTLTAKMLAYELRLPLYTVQVDRLVTKFMGVTSAKLRQIFDLALKSLESRRCRIRLCKVSQVKTDDGRNEVKRDTQNSHL